MANAFDLSKLSPMQAARVETALSKQFRYSDGIRSLGDNIRAQVASGQAVAKSATDGMIDYKRSTFNRMNQKEQAAYIARLESKRLYWIDFADGTSSAIPKLVFDVLALPDRTREELQ